MIATEPTTTIPTVTPAPEYAVLRLPVSYLAGADTAVLYVYGRCGIDILKFKRQGNGWELETRGE